MPTKQDAAIRKRQQIAKASRMMFLWVAGASVIVGASTVLIILFTQKLYFNERVLSEKGKTETTLKQNNAAVEDLKNSIRVLNTNQALAALKVPADKDSIQVVFDALPSTPNSTALGTALQSPALLGQEGVRIDSLSVKPISGVEGDSSSSSSSSAGDNTISFDFTISVDAGKAGVLKDVMKKLEASIRSINITSFNVELQSGRVTLTASGVGYYEPAKTIQLNNKVVK